ncbi:hypothetical protein AVEN_219938-1 [Araneus ventricosus]|uniref:Uncharacterized protein n=1 Tax=Araneus ventricosus TaxID=182803 RepID=A0A4Y2LIZ1_ARAVE|nr:hypothetical protein AVEN_219938-1 [Araneus ventricosus]
MHYRLFRSPPTTPPVRLTPTHSPPPPHGGFWLLERAPYPPGSNFSSLTPTYFPLSDTPTGDSSHEENQLRWNSELSLCLRQLSSEFHIDEWVCHPVFQKMLSGTLVNVPLYSRGRLLFFRKKSFLELYL